MALVLGRPMIISNYDCDIQLPIDCDIPEFPSRTVPMALSNKPENRPTSLSASLIRYSISTNVHLIRELRLDTPHPKDYSMVGVLHQQALSILNNTKPVLRHQNPDTSWDSRCPYLPQLREELLTIVYTFLTALHRPHINTHVESLEAVLQAGVAVLDSQQRLFDLAERHHHILCHLSFYTVDAAILLSVVMALYSRQILGDTANVHSALHQAIARLSEMAPVNPTAKSGLEVIQRFYQGIHKSYDSCLSDNLTPTHLASSGVYVQDIRGALNRGQLNYQDYGPSDPRFSSGNPTEDFSTADGFAPTHYFDQSYWLHQVDGIYSAANHTSDFDLVSEPR